MHISNFRNPASILLGSIILITALLPFFYVPFPYLTVLQSKIFLIALTLITAVITYGYQCYRERAFVYPRSLMIIPVIAIPIVYVASAFASGSLSSSLASGTGQSDAVALVTLFAGIFALTALVARSAERVPVVLMRALMIGVLVLLVVQTLHVFAPSISLGALYAATSNVFGTWHEVGIMAGLGVFLSYVLWRTPVLGGYWKFVALALAPLSVFLLVVVNMYDVWYALTALALLYAAYLFFTTRSVAFRPQFIASVCVGVCALFGALFSGALYEILPQKFQILEIEVRPSLSGTFEIGKSSATSIRTTLLGTGPNTFSKQWSLHKPSGINTTDFWNVNFASGVGFIPTTFITVGIIGLIAWAALFATLALAFVKHVLRAREHLLHPVRTTLLFSALYLALFHFVYVPSVTLSALTFIFLGAIASSEGVISRSVNMRSRSVRDWAVFAALIICLGSIVLASFATVRAAVSDVYVNRGVFVFNSDGNAEAALTQVSRALTVRSSNDRAHLAAVELGLIRFAELSAKSGTSDTDIASLRTSLETTIQHGLAAVSIDNSNYQNWLSLARLYQELAGAGVEGAYDNARAAYEKALEDNPNNPLPLVQLAQLELAADNMEAALPLLDRAITLKSNFAAAYFVRSQVNATQGNAQAAIIDASNAAQYAPEDSLAWYNLGAILYAARNYEAAVPALERAVAIQENYANALYVLGLSYYELGRGSDAIVTLEKVAESNPENEELAKTIAEVKNAGRRGSR